MKNRSEAELNEVKIKMKLGPKTDIHILFYGAGIICCSFAMN
jgi:hypothetical protein